VLISLAVALSRRLKMRLSPGFQRVFLPMLGAASLFIFSEGIATPAPADTLTATQGVAPDEQTEALLQKLMQKIIDGHTVSPLQDNAFVTWEEISKRAQEKLTPNAARALQEFIGVSQSRAENEGSPGRELVAFELRLFAGMARDLLHSAAPQQPESDTHPAASQTPSVTSATTSGGRSTPPEPLLGGARPSLSAITAPTQTASVPSATISAKRSTPAEPRSDGAQPSPSAILAGTEPRLSQDDGATAPDSQPVMSQSVADDSHIGNPDPKQATRRPARQLNLRITRDMERCPKVVCYKWHLLTRGRKPPRHTTVDLAGLRLPPNLRGGVDKGDIDLIIEAIEQHRKIDGRDTLIFVATKLSGVTPNERRL